MRLTEIDCSKLLFDLQAEDLVEQLKNKFPEFSLYEAKVDQLKVAQYIVLMCDKHSPLQAEKTDLLQRKYACAVMAKFPMSKKVFTPEAEKIVIGENDATNQTMVAYISSYGQPNYTLLQAYLALMSFETGKIFAGNTGKDSAKTIHDVSDRIQKLTRDFFNSGDTDEYSKVCQALYSRIEKERLRLRPEQIIRYLEDEGALPEDFSPYPSDYKIDLAQDMIFVGDGSKK
jgi:hypothetical protein